MMSTIYNVITRFSADDRGVRGTVDRMARDMERLERRAERGRRSLGRLGTAIGIGLGGAAAAGVGLAVRQMGTLRREVENARISMASVFNLHSLNTFEQGLTRASGLMKDFRLAAAVSPGTTQDMTMIGQAIMPSMARIIPTDEEIVSLAQRTMGASHTLMGGDVAQGGADMNRILGGQAGAESVLWQRIGDQVLKSSGMDSVQDFNKFAQENARGAFEAVMDVMSRMDEANEALSQTFGGRLSTFQAHINNFLLSSGGVFDSVSERLQGINEWFDANEDSVEAFAARVGDGLSTAFDKVADAMGFVVKHGRAILTILAGVAAYKSVNAGLDIGAALVTSRGAGIAANYVMQAGGAGAGIGRGIAGAPRRGAGFAGDVLGEILFGEMLGNGRSRGARTVQGARRVPGAISGAFRSAPGAIAGAARGAPGMMAAGARGAGVMAMAAPGMMAAGAAKGIGALVTGLSALSAILAPLLVVVGMVAGAFRVMEDRGNEITIFFHNEVKTLMGELDKFASLFGFSGEGAFGASIKAVVDWLGGGVVGTLGVAVMVIRKTVEGLNWFVRVMDTVGTTLSVIGRQINEGGWRSVDFGAAWSAANQAATERARIRDLRARGLDPEGRPQLGGSRTDEGGDPEGVETTAQEGAARMEVNVTLYQENRTDANPDTIAFRTLDLLSSYMEGKGRESVAGAMGRGAL